MRVIGLDFEVFYDTDYSLSSKSMTTEQYIRDPRFELIGVSIKHGLKAPAKWFSGSHSEIVDFLDGEINWEEDAVLAHHAAFDGAILSWILNRRPKVWIDTLSMARPKHLKTTGVSLAALAKHYNLKAKGTFVRDAKGKRRKDFTAQELADYGAYCCDDVDITYELFAEFAKSTSALEMRVIDHTIRMFTEPKFRLNQQVLEAYHKEVVDNKEKLIADAKQANRDPFMSNDLFAELLRANGVEPPTKWSAKQKKLVYAFAKTDKGMKDLLAHDDPAVQALAACRLGVKTTIEETRAQRFIDISKRGMLPIMLNYWGAGTGRFSGGDKINPQNLKRGGTLRSALEAPVGFQVISSDLSQIEARILALVAEQDDLVQDFVNKMDVYSLFASEVYGRTITKADQMERFVGKTCILGLGYYTGAAKLRETLRIGNGGISVVVDLEEAQRIVKLWRKKNNKIVNFWKSCGLALDNMVIGGSGYVSQKFDIKYSGEEVTLPNGAVLRYPGLERRLNSETGEMELVYKDRNQWKKIYSGLLCENIVQALARAVIVECLVEIGDLYGVALQAHDELVSIVPTSTVETARATIDGIMVKPVPYLPGLPLACETNYGPSYGAAK